MINFDEWVKLNKENPAEFERKRIEEIEKLISTASPRQKEELKKLQWQIDLIRQKHNPLAATKIISGLMAEKLLEQSNNFLELQKTVIKYTTVKSKENKSVTEKIKFKINNFFSKFKK